MKCCLCLDNEGTHDWPRRAGGQVVMEKVCDPCLIVLGSTLPDLRGDWSAEAIKADMELDRKLRTRPPSGPDTRYDG